MAQEALQAHVNWMSKDGDLIPKPSSLEAVMEAPENKDAIAFLVPITPPAGKAIRINMTVNENLLLEIDQFAKRRGRTRSRFLQRLLEVL